MARSGRWNMLSRQTSSTLAGNGQSHALLQDLHQGLQLSYRLNKASCPTVHKISMPFVLLAGHPQLSGLTEAIECNSYHIIGHEQVLLCLMVFNYKLWPCFLFLHCVTLVCVVRIRTLQSLIVHMLVLPCHE